MSFKALIFDVDGTLAETEAVHLDAFNAAFKEAGLDWVWDAALYRELLKTTGGKERIRVYIRDHLKKDPKPWADQIIDLHAQKTAYYVEFVKSGHLKLRPGIQSLIDEARAEGMALAIATTTSHPNVQALCQAVWGQDMDTLFDVIAAGDDVPNKKPASDVFDLALERLGLKGNQCVAFEDSYNGMLSALDANIPTIVVPSFFMGDGDFSKASLLAESYEAVTLNTCQAVHSQWNDN